MEDFRSTVVFILVLVVCISFYTVHACHIHSLYRSCFPVGKMHKINTVLSSIALDILGKERLKTCFSDLLGINTTHL